MTFSTFRRPVSATERLYLAARRLAPPFAIQLVITGEGRLDLPRLTEAVGKASEACPGARLIRRGDEWIDSGVAPRVLAVHHDVSLDRLDDEPVLTADLGSDGRTCEVVLAESGTQTSVVVRAFHGVMDAQGLNLWVSEIFRALRGEEPLGAADPDADHDLVADVGREAGRPTRLLPTRRGPLGRTGPAPADRAFHWRHRQISSTTPAAVARVCARLAERTEGASRFMVPVDLRRHRPELRSTANLSLPLFVDVESGAAWPAVHAQVLRRLSAGRELAEMDNGGLARLPGGVSRGILRTANRLGARRDRNLVSAIVSHAGRIDLHEVSAPGFAARRVAALPVHTGLVPLSIVMLECGGVTALTVSSRAGLGVVDRLDEMLDELDAALADGGSAAHPVPALPVERRRYDDESIDSCFRRQAVARPDAPAVYGAAAVFTYAELDHWVDAIALHLIDRGLGPGAVVGVLDDRTPSSVAAQLAVVRIGAAVLPLDRKHPDARLAAVLSDAGAAYLLIGRGIEAPGGTELPVAVIEDVPIGDDVPPVSWQVSGERIAYLTYTSGSTGRPKGVAVTHRGVVNLAGAAADWWRLGPATRFAHHHTPAADMACAAIFTPLMTGGSVVLVPGDVSHVMLSAMLGESGANTFIFTPSLLETVLRLGLSSRGARTVVFGGERLGYGLVQRARAFFGPDTRLVNSYGPTELTMVCATEVIDDDLDRHDPADGVPIGSPPANTSVFLLDDEQRPIPAGAVGELCFGGPQVALGYLGRPDLTRDRFVTLPGGERVYRTGDLGRVVDGRLDYLGRVDEQVKVRGNRVEPDEVRSIIEEHPGVDRAAVIGRESERGGRLLAGYVVLAAPEAVGVDAIRDFLRARVPAYMVPTVIELVEDLPLSLNGKLDVGRLRGIGAAAAENAEVSGVQGAGSPGTTVRDAEDRGEEVRDADSLEAVRLIWVAVLKVPEDRVVEDADFFALGGDSLDSLEMLSRVAKAIVGPAGEAAFVAQLEGLVADMTLRRVLAAAHLARDGAVR